MEIEIERPVTIGFTRYDEKNEFAADVDLTFRTTSGMTLGELHSFCERFALVLGYNPETVEEYFGEDQEDMI